MANIFFFNLMLTTLKRIARAGWLGFWRNKWLSSATVAIMAITLLGLTSLLLVNVLINSLIANLEDKVDISVYFKLETGEDKILETKDNLAKLSEVRSVEYVSAEQALQNFKERHQDNAVLMQSLEEVGVNPLEATLNIKAQAASQYEVIVNFFQQADYQEIIDKINYTENRAVILRLASITKSIRQIGLIAILILAGLAVLITFNTIRLAIYTSRKEIQVMKLVGASNWFVRGPFIIEGVLYGLVAALVSLLILLPLLWYVSPKISAYLPGADLFRFFWSNFFWLFLLQMFAGAILGSLSSVVAIRRYLEV